ncbi:hypothetical protein NIES4073_14180 [Kalymmatonema gypsitolerans NIES-4073]|nr:hypothetical protein NIES4073_14180 [Scytonema sp. NIES-4073]
MQDELKNVISEAMDTRSKFEQEPVKQIAEAELCEELLETVAGGICTGWTTPIICLRYTMFRNANKLV